MPMMLRRSHDWRARPTRGGEIEWYARDANKARRLCVIQDLGGEGFRFSSLLRRGHVSAFLAGCVRGTWLARRLQEKRALIIGSFEGGGRLRISINPSQSWLGRLHTRAGRNVWNLVEDRSLMRFVPPAAVDGTPLGAALFHILENVIRAPPIHPLECPPKTATGSPAPSRPYVYPGTRVHHQWPRIEKVSYGDGWRK
eukprot:gene14529-biopygen13042